MKLLITSFVVLLGMISPSVSSDLKVIEKYNFGRVNDGLLQIICLRGYEFVMVCEDSNKGQCDFRTDEVPQIQQILNDKGGGKKC